MLKNEYCGNANNFVSIVTVMFELLMINCAGQALNALITSLKSSKDKPVHIVLQANLNKTIEELPVRLTLLILKRLVILHQTNIKSSVQ